MNIEPSENAADDAADDGEALEKKKDKIQFVVRPAQLMAVSLFPSQPTQMIVTSKYR